MPLSTDKQYLVNGDPVTAAELIELAQGYGYASLDGLYTTSEAAYVLREETGATVEVNRQ